MIRQIVDVIVPTLASLNFADVVAGVVVTISKQSKSKDDGIVVEKFPAYYREPEDVCANYSTYIDLIPNSKKKSIIYFEEISNFAYEDEDAYYVKMSSTVRLICWANLKLINQAYSDAYLLKQAIIKTIPETLPNIANRFSFIRLHFDAEEVRDVGLFSNYTYIEEQKQYLLYPYDYFGLNYTFDYWVAKRCEEDVIIDPATC